MKLVETKDCKSKLKNVEKYGLRLRWIPFLILLFSLCSVFFLMKPLFCLIIFFFYYSKSKIQLTYSALKSCCQGKTKALKKLFLTAFHGCERQVTDSKKLSQLSRASRVQRRPCRMPLNRTCTPADIYGIPDLRTLVRAAMCLETFANCSLHAIWVSGTNMRL